MDFYACCGSRGCIYIEGLDDELRTLLGIYAPPAERLLLATYDEQPAGCVCLKGHNVLATEARQSEYQRIVLDSHIEMKKEHMLYQAVGFQIEETPDDFPVHLKPTVVFME